MRPSEYVERTCTEDQRDFILDVLDEEVHEAKALEAANINNEGIDAQMAYLGHTSQYIDDILVDFE